MKIYLCTALAFFVCATCATAGSLTFHFNNNGYGRGDSYGFSYSTPPRQQYGHRKYDRDDNCRRGYANTRKHGWRPRQEQIYVVKEYVPVYVCPPAAPKNWRQRGYAEPWD